MNFAALVRRNLAYQWRGNLAVLLGIALGSAVLTGALLVGDSLRGSLRDLSLEQLGWVDGAIAPGRLFPESFADQFPSGSAAPAILLHASASPDGAASGRVASLNLFGVTPRFFDAAAPIGDGESPDIVLNEPLAKDLGVAKGDRLWLNVQKSDSIPRETLLGKRKSDDTLEAVAVVVKEILPNEGMARFALRPSPEPARNGFVSLKFLQGRLELGDRINVVLLNEAGTNSAAAKNPKLTLRDWGLKLTTPTDRVRALVRFLDRGNKSGELRRTKWHGRVPDALAKFADADGVLSKSAIESFYLANRRYLMLQSDRLYLDPPVEAAIEKAVGRNWSKGEWPRTLVLDTDPPSAAMDEYRPILVYLADRVAVGGAETPYATVAAILPDQAPGVVPGMAPLGEGEILLAEWPGSPLKANVGDVVELDYYFPDAANRLVLNKARFTYRGGVPLEGSADDPDWTPEYPGLTDRLDIGSWENPPFPPYSTKKLMERIKPADEDFWKRFRAAPKAYVAMAAGQKLFATRFGKLTELRIDVPADKDVDRVAADFEGKLLAVLDAKDAGFTVQRVRELALRSSTGATDFGEIFLGFSFFLIVSALLLVGLLVRLNLERRSSEIGLLAATGWTPRLIGRMLRREGWVLVAVGSALGLLAAHWFASAMLKLLSVNWPGQGTLQFLKLHETPRSYAVGFGASAVVSAATLWLAFRILRRRTPRQLLAADLTPLAPVSAPRQGEGSKVWRRISTWVVVVNGLGAAALLGTAPLANNHMALAMGFFFSGFCVLAALLALAWIWLNARGRGADPQPTLLRLGVRNAGRNPVRSLLTIGLLAAATYMIVAVQAFHREPAADFFNRAGGSGGFRLYAQTEAPLFQHLGDASALDELGVKPEIAAKIAGVESLRVQPGDDASCLNLYKPLRPRLLGVSATSTREPRFAFAANLAENADDRANPWRLLDRTTDDGSIPAIVDANSAEWILKVKLGGEMEINDAAGDKVRLRIVGLLKESLFQSEVLVSEASFLKLFPSQQGYQFFLIRCGEDDQDAVRNSLSAALAAQGGQVRPTFDRLAAYLAVENTYLATFQALGGLGLLLGAVGLAIVLVRGVWERRAEFALLRALGFRGGQLRNIVLAENGVLLLLGLAIGCAAALISVAPHIFDGNARLVAGPILFVLAGVGAVGIAAALLAVAASLRCPPLEALRRE